MVFKQDSHRMYGIEVCLEGVERIVNDLPMQN